MLGDGMADYRVPELENMTPLESADKPWMDYLAKNGMVGMARTIPEGMPPGSDTANLSVLGYDPAVYYSGRSPLEAASLGIPLGDGDVTYRCNLVCLSEEADLADATMLDYSSDEISTEEAVELIRFLQGHLQREKRELHAGISYRHCFVLREAETGAELTPPHDISGKPVRDHLPRGAHSEELLELMRLSYRLLRDHPVNRARQARGLHPANCCWFWGEGTRPKLTPFLEKYGVRGGVVCAVDLVKGLGVCAGMRVADVPGATGGMVTDYAAKCRAALQFLQEDCDLVYIHVEAPDECGHHGEPMKKVHAIEAIDREILGPLFHALQATGEPYSILLMPDHPTPLALRTHTAEPVPFVLYRSDRNLFPSADRYAESYAMGTKLFIEQGHTLMQRLVDQK